MKLVSKSNDFHTWKFIWKFLLQNRGHFASVSICHMLNKVQIFGLLRMDNDARGLWVWLLCKKIIVSVGFLYNWNLELSTSECAQPEINNSVCDNNIIYYVYGLRILLSLSEAHVIPLQWRHNGRWRLKSTASRWSTQRFVRAQIKEGNKTPRHWPLWGEFTGNRWIPSTKGQ